MKHLILKILLAAAIGGWFEIIGLTSAEVSSPFSDPEDLTIWPNQTSHANSDPWLPQNHDHIRRMNPRLLVVNFSNKPSRDKLDRMIGDLIGALREASRYHGYNDPMAEPFRLHNHQKDDNGRPMKNWWPFLFY